MKFSQYGTIYERAMRVVSNANQDLTLKAFQKRTAQTREAVKLAYQEYVNDVKELDGTYIPKIAQQKREPLEQEYRAIVKLAKQRCYDDLARVLDAKRQQFSKTHEAPSEADMRLLTALSMRQTLTPAEIAEVADKLNGNYHAQKLLGEIAHRHDIPFPRVADADEVEAALNDAERYAQRMIDFVDVPDDKALNFSAVSFFKYPDTRTEADAYFERLDGNFFTAAQADTDEAAEQAETVKQTADKSGEMWSQVTLTGREMLYAIANQFHVDSADIRAANPGIDLSNLYSGQKIYIPSTRYSFTPDINGAHVQADQEVRLVPKPVYETPKGPNGEEVGDDIILK